ncbi:MAG TPA: tyrosinase family protein, partial [Thermomicrobiales bacterium]|nr:tyrosinase family protein [Thermomicrobiales bacterium]
FGSGALGTSLIGRNLTFAAQGAEANVTIIDFGFDPADLSIEPGTTVVWINQGAVPHTVTADDGSFDSGQLDPGGSFTQLFDAEGTFAYHCEIHPDMVGSVVVGATTSTYVRKNVHTLPPDAPELLALESAFAQMQQWNADADPLNFVRSQRYQGNMHMVYTGTEELPLPDPLPDGWNTCEHSFFVPNNRFFLPWHRMYLYWFERIVRELSGDQTFALPYWDYSDPAQRRLPAAFTVTTSSLYTPFRDPDVNLGNLPLPSVRPSTFDHCPGMRLLDYTPATFSFESQPHGGIHNWVGGDSGWMADPTLAARDPIFWLHHCNIDRIWESWIQLAGGRANPTDTTWLTHENNDEYQLPYNFFDEHGNAVTTVRVVSEVKDLSALGYQYEALLDLSLCPQLPGGPIESGAPPTGSPEAQEELGNSTPEGGIEVGPDPAQAVVEMEQPEAATASGVTVLTIDGIRTHDVTAVTVEVYINLPEGTEPDSTSPYYVGNLYLFGMGTGTPMVATPEGGHAGHGDGARTQDFYIAQNVLALDALGEWTGEANITLVPYYTASAEPPDEAAASPVAAEAPPGPWVTVESITISA